MIVVDVKLDVYGEGVLIRPLARVLISNDATGSATRGNYNVRVLRKPNKRRPFSILKVQRRARVENHPRKSKHVLTLVRKALEEAGY
jgi:hypothetical protein